MSRLALLRLQRRLERLTHALEFHARHISKEFLRDAALHENQGGPCQCDAPGQFSEGFRALLLLLRSHPLTVSPVRAKRKNYFRCDLAQVVLSVGV